MRKELLNSINDPNNTHSIFLMALIEYLLEKGDDETKDFVDQIDNNGTINWDLLYKWSINSQEEEDIDFADWVNDPEAFRAWLQGNRRYMHLINKRSIDRNSAREVARELFTGQPGAIRLYASPETGQLQALLVDQWPSDGYEYIRTDREGRIEYGQQLRETDEELEDAFGHWWDGSGNEWIAELENEWRNHESQ